MIWNFNGYFHIAYATPMHYFAYQIARISQEELRKRWGNIQAAHRESNSP